MHLIYLHCHCMIAASDAQESSEGFCHLWGKLRGVGRVASTTKLHGHTQTPAFNLSTSEFRHNKCLKWPEWTNVLDGILNTRGWAYQERQLSPRISHFTKLGIMWEYRLSIGAGDSSWLQLKRAASYAHGYNNPVPQAMMFRKLDLDKSRLSLDDLMEMWLFKV
jgi:hypothetical protein